MELNITKFFTTAHPMDYSASNAEMGGNAGPITWNRAKHDANYYNFLDTDEKREAFRKHVKGFGAWNDQEIAAMDNDELNALLLQMIAGDVREAGIVMHSPDWEEYEQGAQEGIYSGRLFKGIDNAIYYYIGE